MIGTVLIVLLILALLGVFPRWSHSRNWGYAPSGGVGTILLIVIVLVRAGASRPLVGAAPPVASYIDRIQLEVSDE